MKTTRILLLFSMLSFFFGYANSLFAQGNTEKKVIITKRSVDADGTERTETLIKKGKAAQNFDADQYIREQRSDRVLVEVKVLEGEEERSIVVSGKNNKTEEEDLVFESDSPRRTGPSVQSPRATGKRNSPAFLGVEPDSDECDNEAGLVVSVVRGSAADQAGLRDNDKILTINNTPTDKWADLTRILKQANAGDRMQIEYERYGKKARIETVLTTRAEVETPEKTQKGFLGVSDQENAFEQDKPGVQVSITDGSSAEKAGLKDGDVIFQLGEAPIADFEDISDFMAYTQPGEQVEVLYERNGKRVKTSATLSESKNSWNVNIGDWDFSNIDINEVLEDLNINEGNCTVNVRAKDACLGVFSDAYASGEVQGSRIHDFATASAAREANMQKGDIITELAGQPIQNHDDLWNEIARHAIGETVVVAYLRAGKTLRTTVELKACQDNSSKVQIVDGDGGQVRNFTSWNWNDSDQRNLRDHSIITIRKGEGDAPTVSTLPGETAQTPERSLSLRDFRAFPDPTESQVTLTFKGQPVATTVSFFDLAGRQLFREELNAFSGFYQQQFDLSEYKNGTITIQVQQGELRFSDFMEVD